MAKAQSEISPAMKDSTNPFFKSKYADLTSVWNACRGPLTKNGLSIIQTTDTRDGQLMLITTLAHASGQWIRSYLPIVNEKNNIQGLGSASTYNRRYALSAIVGIICDEDDDGNGAATPTKSSKPDSSKPLISADDLVKLKSMLAKCDNTFSKNVENYYLKNFGSWEKLPRDQFEKALDGISNHLKNKYEEFSGAA